MPTYKVNVKWGRETFKEVELNTEESPVVFKAQLYALTGVTPERQKVMFKGISLKDDSWNGIKVADNATVMLMGSKEEDVPVEPAAKPRFVEDMNDAELATASNMPAGLVNLGNTCYMNATVQCLKTVPELKEALQLFEGNLHGMEGMASAHGITVALRDLFNLMDKKALSVPPLVLLQVLQMVFPRFAEKNKHGSFLQQDANECWMEIVRMLQQKLNAISRDGFTSAHKLLIDQFFGGTMQVELKCDECNEEPITKSEESFLHLSCFISQDVKYMHSGLLSKLQEKLTKHSEILKRNAVFTRSARISRLPAYLTVQFVRFYYKEKEAVNAKILKEVKFPLEFDAYDLCTPALQERLKPMRDRFKEYDDRKSQECKSKKLSTHLETPENEDILTKEEAFSFPDDLGSNSSGLYTLQAVLTHLGRSSSSGHYVAWVKHNDDMWIKCDDDVVTPVPQDSILKLCGGGDWHIAYVLLYGPRILKVPVETNPAN